MIAYYDLSTHRAVSIIAICTLAVFFLLGAAGCGPDDAVLAKVGDVEITDSELDRFSKRLPVHLRSQKQGVEAEREYLHPMIDQEMLLLEARARGLDSSALILLELADVEQQHLSERYVQEVIAAKIEIGPEDVERAFHDMGFDRERLLSRIIVPENEEQARDVVAQL